MIVVFNDRNDTPYSSKLKILCENLHQSSLFYHNLPTVTNMPEPTSSRPILGDFSSIVCFKAVITGIEEALGEKATAIALIAAGRTRGKNLANELGLSGATNDLDFIATKLNAALGTSGTRLMAIDKIVQEGDIIKVYCSETICSAGEPQGSPRKCTFTLGAVWGALTEITGKKLHGLHTDSVLRGGTHDVFEFTPVN
ncbi:MAG: hypothetical protein RLZZ135_594 [Cyanobacteriota bacterium]|jgi:predicted hydrocarbon binding protein